MTKKILIYDSRELIDVIRVALKKLDLDAKKTSVSEFIEELGGEEDEEDDD